MMNGMVSLLVLSLYGNLETPTPSSTIDDIDELSSTDDEWMYPPTPPRLPSIELPLRQLEDLHVHPTGNLLEASSDVDEPVSISAALNPSSLPTQGILDPIPELDEYPHPASPPGPSMLALDTQNNMDIENPDTSSDVVTPITDLADLYAGMPPSPSSESTLSSLPSLETPPTSPEPSEPQVAPSSDSAWKPHEGWTTDEWPTDAWDAWGVLAPNEEPTAPPHIDEDCWYPDGPPPRSYPQQTSASAGEMRRTLSRLTAHLAPLTTVRFGSRMSYRTVGRLRKAIPQATFQRLFRDFGTYENLTNSVSSSYDDQRKVPNRWQTHLPRLRRIRQFVTQYIEDAENLLRYHGFIDGLKEYAATHDWRVEKQPCSLFYPHELEYFDTLHRFLIQESYFDLAYRTRRLLTCVFEQPADLWTIVFTILGRLEPPTFDYQLSADFVPRTDEAAIQKRANFKQHGSLEWPQI